MNTNHPSTDTASGADQNDDHSHHLPAELAHYPLFHIPGPQHMDGESSDHSGPDLLADLLGHPEGYNPYFSGASPLVYGDGPLFPSLFDLNALVTAHETPHGHMDDPRPDPILAAAIDDLSMEIRCGLHPTLPDLAHLTPEFDIVTGKVTWTPVEDDTAH